jgi:hypothetical protein
VSSFVKGVIRGPIGALRRGLRAKMSDVSIDPATPTALLLAWGRDDKSAFDRLVPLVHHELRRLSHRVSEDDAVAVVPATHEARVALEMSVDTVKRDWRFAKRWRPRELKDTR